MFIIKNTQTGRKHREPSRPSWKGTEYKTLAAARAGVTRTIKYYQKAIQQVADAVAEGKPEYAAPMYNAFRDATEDHTEHTVNGITFGRSYDLRKVATGETLEVMSVADYGDPQVTRTGRSPYNGNEITVTIGINQVGTHMDPLCESHYTN